MLRKDFKMKLRDQVTNLVASGRLFICSDNGVFKPGCLFSLKQHIRYLK